MSRFIELVITLVLLVLGTSICISSLRIINNNATKYEYYDKSAIVSLNVNEVACPETEIGDIAILLFIQDKSSPYPAAIQINDGLIYAFDENWFTNSISSSLNCYNTNILDAGLTKVDAFKFEYVGGISRWKISCSN